MYNQFGQQPGSYGYPGQSFMSWPLMQSQQRMEIIRVNGEGGARAYQMPPSSNALLLDEANPLVWLVQTDGAGYKTVTPYTITPYQAAPAPDLGTLEQRISRLEGMINGWKPDPQQTQQPGGNAGE
jgi:hypothetical protein